MSERAELRRDGAIVRFARLTPQRQFRLVEASLLVCLAVLVVRFLPFRRSVRFSAHPLRRPPGAGAVEFARDVRWAVEAAALHLPWRIVCFPKGLAAQSMLRRRGLDATLHYGIRRGTDGKIDAHVWVVCGNESVVGGTEASNFRCVTMIPDRGE